MYPVHPKLDPSNLSSWTDGNLIDYWVDVLRDRFKFTVHAYDEYLARLPEPLRDAYATWLVWMQVGNGGFEQYFFNCGKGAATPAIDGFKHLGCRMSAQLMRKALSRLSSSGVDRDEVVDDHELFNDLNERFGEIETEFYSNWPAFVREHAQLLRH